MDSFLFSINTTMPVFAMILIGHIIKRLHIIDDHFSNTANKMVYGICLPCLVFSDLQGTHIRETFQGKYVGFCFLVTLLSILGTWFFAKKFMKDSSLVGAFVQGSYRSSAAILGIAFIENVYGGSGMAPLMIIGSVPLYNIFAVIILTFESNAQSTLSKRKSIQSAFVGVLKNPIIIGIFVGLLASYFEISLPEMANKTINNLAVIAAPLALISIGASFEGKKALTKIKPTAIASFLKLIGWTILFIPIAIYLGFRNEMLLAILIMLASPCTPTAFIMTKNLDGDYVLASSIIVATTLFSSITLTVFIFLLRLFHWI